MESILQVVFHEFTHYNKFIKLYKLYYSNNIFDSDIKAAYKNWISAVESF